MKNQEMAKLLKWIAMVIIGVGILCSVMNLAQFNDRNLGLMVGIGFLVGGGQILLFGVIAPLMQRSPETVTPAIPSKDSL